METPPPSPMPGGAGRLWLLLLILRRSGREELVGDRLMLLSSQVSSDEDDGLPLDAHGRRVSFEVGYGYDCESESGLDHPVPVHHRVSFLRPCCPPSLG